MRLAVFRWIATRVIAGCAAGCLALLLLTAGCVSKATADARARMAYLAGQQAAYAQFQQQQIHGPSISFIGPVQNHFVKWTDGLTLGQAIVSAAYMAPNDPRTIVIRRQGAQIPFDPKRLLSGDDFPLAAGDIVELQP